MIPPSSERWPQPRQVTQDCNQRNHFPRHLGHNLPTEVQSQDNSATFCFIKRCLAVLIVTCLARWSIPMSGQQGGAEWESTCKILSPGLTDSWVGWDRGQPCDISANQGLSKVKKWPIRGRISEGSVGSCIGRELTQKRIVIKAPWTNLISPCWQSNWFQVRLDFVITLPCFIRYFLSVCFHQFGHGPGIMMIHRHN